MNGVLNKFRKRNIQTNLYHFVLVIFVVAVSVCLVTGLFINYLTLNNATTNFYTKSHLPSLIIETNQISSEDEEFFSRFEYGKRLCFESNFTSGSSEHSATFLVSNGKISTPYIVDGAKGNGCFVDSRFIEKYHLGINFSKIYINYTFSGETKRLEFKVLGSISLAEDLLVDENCTVFIDESVFLNAIKANFSGLEDADLSALNYNQILIKSDVSSNDIELIKNHFESSTSTLEKMTARDDIASVKALKNEVRNSKIMLYSFPILFVIISILVVVSAIGQLVLKERYNIGLLKSLGVSNGELVSNYSGYGAFICFIGACIGLLLSPLIIPNMTFETYDKIFNLPRDEVKMIFPFVLIISVLFISTLIGYFSAFFVCLDLTKKTPKECMSKTIKINLSSKNKSKKTSTAISGTFRNMKINLSRTIMSAVGIFGSSLLCLIGFGVENAFKEKETTKEILTMGTFSNIFKLFSIILMLLTILILITQIFKERSKEMAMLKVHGTTDAKIWVSLLLEMLFSSAIGFVIAGVFCEPVFVLVLKLFGINGHFFIDFLSFLKTFLVVFGFTFAVALFGFIKVHKLNLVDLIKFSE